MNKGEKQMQFKTYLNVTKNFNRNRSSAGEWSYAPGICENSACTSNKPYDDSKQFVGKILITSNYASKLVCEDCYQEISSRYYDLKFSQNNKQIKKVG